MSFRLLGARPWFTLWEPRVFRLAALRPGMALCARMKEEGCEHKDNGSKRSSLAWW